jgi:hypothetical protein
MTFALILNIVFAAFVLTVIPGMLVFAIRTSRNAHPPRTRAARRPVAHPSVAGPRFSAYSRRETA